MIYLMFALLGFLVTSIVLGLVFGIKFYKAWKKEEFRLYDYIEQRERDETDVLSLFKKRIQLEEDIEEAEERIEQTKEIYSKIGGNVEAKADELNRLNEMIADTKEIYIKWNKKN